MLFFEEEDKQLRSRTIPGTRKLHSFVPISTSKVRVRAYSASDTFREERVTLAKNDLLPEAIVGFVTCLLEGNWWLACVLEVIEDSLTFLYPHGPSKNPRTQNIRTVPISDILTLVDPRTRTGRVYPLMKKETTYASQKLRVFLQE